MSSYKEILMILLLAHILSDFYFQSESMAIKKKTKVNYVCIHSMFYGIVTWIILNLIFKNIESIFIWVIILSHLVVDLSKYYLEKRGLIKKYQKYIFTIDQIIHIFILIVVAYFMIKSGKVYKYNPMFLNVLNTIGISISFLIVLFVQILLIHKPTNIFIMNILQSYKPANKESNNENTKKAENDGDAERAISQYKAVSEEDDCYTEAQQKIEELENTFKTQLLNEAESYVQDKQYSEAISKIEKIISVLGNSEDLESLKQQYLEMKSEQYAKVVVVDKSVTPMDSSKWRFYRSYNPTWRNISRK